MKQISNFNVTDTQNSLNEEQTKRLKETTQKYETNLHINIWISSMMDCSKLP